MWLIASVYAAVDVDQARSMLVELQPLVEREAGRRFDTLPDLAIARTDDVAVRLAEQRQVYARFLGSAADAQARIDAGHAADVAILANSSAIYSRLDDTIYLLEDRLAADLGAAPPEMLAPLLRCTLAHELTHALQDRHVDGMGTTGEGGRALAEGQAMLVARRICRATASRADVTWAESYGGLDRMLAVGDDALALTYVAGLVYAADLGGNEPIWAALAAPPPSMDDIRARYDAYVAPGWAAGLATTAIVEAHVEGAVTLEDASANLVFAELSGGVGPRQLRTSPRGMAAHYAEARTPDAHTVVAVVALEDPASLDPWLASRGALLTHDDGPPSFVQRRGPARLRKPTSPEMLLSAEVTGRWPYQEVWMRRGPLAVAMFRSGKPLKKEDAAGLFEALISQRPGDEEAVARLQRVLVGAPPEAPPPLAALAWSFVARPAFQAIARDDWAACAALLDTARVLPEQQGDLAATAWLCSVMAMDRARADRWVSDVPVRGVPMVIAHARLHYDAGAKRDSLTTLSRAVPATDEERRTLTSLQLALATELGDRGSILRFATKDADPKLRYLAGDWLLQRGRFDDGVRVLAPVCGQLGAMDAARCRQLVASFSP